jgi:hypothetical protein
MDFSDDCTVGLSAAQTKAPCDVGPVGDVNMTDDQAASVTLHPPAGCRPQVSALVEYATP